MIIVANYALITSDPADVLFTHAHLQTGLVALSLYLPLVAFHYENAESSAKKQRARAMRFVRAQLFAREIPSWRVSR